MKNKNIVFILILTIVCMGVIVSCKSGSSSGAGGSNSAPPSNGVTTVLVFDDMSDIPVVNGAASSGKIYIHNYSNADVNNIIYTLNNGVTNSNSGLIDSNGFTLVDVGECSIIKANSFCALDVITPGLSQGSANSAMLQINYTDSNGNQRSSAKIVNYRYYDSSAFNDVSFTAGSVTAIGAQGTTRHVVGYIVGGGTPGTVYSNVRLIPNVTGAITISNGFIDGSQVAAGQSMAVEFKAELNNSVTTGVTVTPYASPALSSLQMSTKHKKNPASLALKDNSDIIGTAMFITLSPNVTSPHLSFGAAPVLNSPTESSVTVQVLNDGNSDANGFSVQNSNESAVNVTNNCGSAIKSNASCSITYRINSNMSGTANIVYLLAGTVVGSDTISWIYEDVTPVIKATVAPTAVSLFMQESTIVVFTVNNISNTDLENVAINYNSGALAVLTTQLADCSEDINNPGSYIIPANGSCHVTTKLTALSGMGTAAANMTITGNANGKSYSFDSDKVVYQVSGFPSLIIVPSNAVSLSIAADNSSVASQVYTITNNWNQSVQVGPFNLQSINASAHQPVIDPDTTGLSNPCPTTGALATNSSCQLRVTYGPWGSDIEASESGSLDLVINYGGDTFKGTYLMPINYSLISNSNNEVTINLAVNNITGNGTQISPYQGSAAKIASQALILTYTNPTGKTMTNFNINTNALPLGLVVDPASTCPYGASIGVLGAGANDNSCSLILNFKQDDLAMIYGPLQGNTLINYPSVSQINADGFYKQSIVADQNNNTGFYAEYKQATVIPSIQPNYTTAESVVLNFTVTNADDYASLDLNVSGVNGLLQNTPIGDGGCLINSDSSADCNLVEANSAITYIMPNYLEAGNGVTIPLQMSFASGQYAYLTNGLVTIYYTAD